MQLIVGAGMSGLLAAHRWPRAKLIDASREPRAAHKALLRFRSDSVSNLTGIECKRVVVHKGIWSEGRFVSPNIQVANSYARKTLPGAPITDHSIWDIKDSERFIPPENFYEQLLSGVEKRIEFGVPFEPSMASRAAPCLSTIPLPKMLSLCGKAGPQFIQTPIIVARWRVPAHVYQTIYYPDPSTPLYRASITDDVLTAELACTQETIDMSEIVELLERSFCLSALDFEAISGARQSYGKIAPLDEGLRKQLVYSLTADHGIYSLGRFAVWRNILLDDVVNDIFAIKRLCLDNLYNQALERSRA